MNNIILKTTKELDHWRRNLKGEINFIPTMGNLHDGHKKLICLGFDCSLNGPNNNVYKDTNAYKSSTENVDQTVWAKEIYKLMINNPTIQWIFVDCEIPGDFLNLDNCSTWQYNELNTHINTKNETT